MRTFDVPKTIQALSAIVEEAGYDHTAQDGSGGIGCTYIYFDGFFLNSVCIVGRLFDRLGILAALLVPGQEESNEQYGACHAGEGMWQRAYDMGVDFDAEAQEFLRAVQYRQDDGKSWGYALAQTVEEHYSKAVDLAVARKENALAALPQPTVDPAEEPLQAWERELLGN